MEDKRKETTHENTKHCTVWICLTNTLEIPEEFKNKADSAESRYLEKIEPTRVNLSSMEQVKRNNENLIRWKM